MNQVFVCGTYFHVYVSLLRAIYRDNKSTRNLLIISDHTPGLSSLYDTLKNSGIFDYILKVPFYSIAEKIKGENFLFRILKRNSITIHHVEAGSQILDYEEFISSSEINLFYNGGAISTYFILKYPNNFIRMLEDGEGNYYSRVGALKAFKRKYLLRTVIGDGLDPEVKEIHVQFPERLVPKLKQKGRILQLRRMQDELTSEYRSKILKIFMDGIDLGIKGEKKLLLITQPLEEKGMSEKWKINTYNKLLNHFKDYNIFIKTHPREITNYHGKLDRPFTEIPKEFPLEMFDLLTGISFELGVTLFSSALYNIKCVGRKIILGREYLSKPVPDDLSSFLSRD